jgi:hypothetical protein
MDNINFFKRAGRKTVKMTDKKCKILVQKATWPCTDRVRLCSVEPISLRAQNKVSIDERFLSSISRATFVLVASSSPRSG